MQKPLLKALRKAFTKGQGLGLVSKNTNTHRVYVLALRTNDGCNHASDKPVIFNVTLSGIILQDYEYIKAYLLKLFSEHGTVLDIVLYEDDFTGSWFSVTSILGIPGDN
ncbi:hypothetical protein BDF21DRAFT_462446 [Thamnidium elegans]|uniref:Uncharacterized protein n=1 Tax=Thamnidium elegans TaxID=101142 RepID=A0A8H7SK97_9FUNG|nr:hypothetical protein INT48_001079 [Thamnidium elegans]KAI8082383.1 hypothetical protein BDF21DRAFT_462446 [Thamnidium elegans]